MKLVAAIFAALAVGALLSQRRASTRLGQRRIAILATGASRGLSTVFVALGCLVVVVAAPVALPLLAVAGLAAIGWRKWQRARLEQAVRRAVPDFLYALAAELRVGRSIASAVAAAAGCGGPLEPSLTRLARSVERGADMADELTALATQPGVERFEAVAAAWRATSPLGASMSGVLERLGEGYEHDDAADDELRAALAGPRSTVVMLTCLPIMGIALGQSVGAHPTRLLLHRPLGWALISGAIVLDAAGVLWSRRIVTAALANR
jgi:tight adherence protein B